MMTERKVQLDRSALKYIAIVTMLIDHIGALVIYPLWVGACYVDGEYLLGNLMPAKAKVLYTVYTILRCIGRIAFPIFSYMVVEGFLHTHSRKKYLLRLVIFALISEIPYEMAFGDGVFDITSQNVIWQYVIAVLMMWFIERFADTREQKGKRIALTVVAVLIACVLAITCDYSFCGMLLIASMYLFRDNKRLYWIGCIISLILIALVTSWIEVFGIVGLLLLELYNGEKGKGSKYLFYIFYPAHLFVLSIVSAFLYALIEYDII